MSSSFSSSSRIVPQHILRPLRGNHGGALGNHGGALASLQRLFSSAAAAAKPSSTSGVTAQAVKQLREITGSSMGHCRKALTESDGDLDAALEWLKKRNVAAAKTRWEKVEDGVLPEGGRRFCLFSNC